MIGSFWVKIAKSNPSPKPSLSNVAPKVWYERLNLAALGSLPLSVIADITWSINSLTLTPCEFRILPSFATCRLKLLANSFTNCSLFFIYSSLKDIPYLCNLWNIKLNTAAGPMFSLPVSLDTAASFLDEASCTPSSIVLSTIPALPSFSSSASNSSTDVIVLPIFSLVWL